MNIAVRKLKFQEIGIVMAIIKKMNIDIMNLDFKNGEELMTKIVNALLNNYDEISPEIIKLISSVTKLTDEQIKELDIDEFVAVLKDIWRTTNIMGLFESGKPAKIQK